MTSSTSLRKWTVGVSLSRRYDSLCWTSGCGTSTRPARRQRAHRVRRVPAEPGVQRPLVAERLRPAADGSDVGVVCERVDDDRRDLAEVVLVEAAHRRGRSAEPNARRDHRRPLVERHGVAVGGQLALLEPLLRRQSGPLGARRSSWTSACRCRR